MFLKLKVARKQYTEVYVEVPDGFDKKRLMLGVNSSLVGTIASEQVLEMDWDDNGWEEDVSVEEISEVDEKEFSDFSNDTLDISLVK